MNEAQMPERIFVRTEDGVHHIKGYGKLTTFFNPTIDTEYIRKDLSVSDGWIDVKERLPKHYGNVLALCQYGVGIAHRTRVTLDNGEVVEGLKWVYRPENDKSFSDGLSASYRTTHWMPLPSPPKDLPSSDGLEHSQHKCGCEEVDAIHKEEWEKQHAIIRAYREVLQNVVDNKGAWWIEAKEVLTRMEGK